MLKKFLKSTATAGITIIVSVLIIAAIVKAGNITPPTGTPTANFYTMSEIYEFIASSTVATEAGHDFIFSDTLAGTGRTLTEIYDALAGLITADKVKSGTTYLGVDGTLAPSGTASSTDCLSGQTFYSGNSWTQKTGSLATQTLSSATTTVSAGFYNATTLSDVDSDLIQGNIKSGVDIFGVTGNYSATYTWTRNATSTSWEGVNEDLDWVKEIGGTAWWSSQTYSYCEATDCTNNGVLRAATNYTGPPGCWNGSNNYGNFNNSALQNYEVITANTNLGDCVAGAGDLVFPDGSVWDKSATNSYSVKLAGCDSNDANASTIWSAAGGSGSQYAYVRNAPSVLSIADAWDGKKNLTTGVNGTHSYSQDGINNDYYDSPSQSWYIDTGDGVGISRLPMIEEYERARQGTSDATASLLYGTANWDQPNWSAEQRSDHTSLARRFNPSTGNADSSTVDSQNYRLWVVAAQ